MMNNQGVLPYEFFIYVPSAQELSSAAQQVQRIATPADLSSWTRIDLADTVSVYARLQQEQQPEQKLAPRV